MRKFLIAIICVLAVAPVFAAGENVATSKAFVDTAVAQEQDKIPANVNGNNGPDQALTNTGTPGTVGTKDIYSASGEYANQMDSLVTAENMNAAVQTAIEAEFKCIKWVDDDPTKDCLLVNIFSAPPQSILPTGYTALEYIESTGTQWVDTGITADASIIIDTRVWHSNNNLPANNDPQTVIGTRANSIYDTNVFQFGFINGLHFFNRYGLGSINGDTFSPNTWYDVHLENRNCTIQGDFTYHHDYEFKQNMNTQGTLYLFATNDSVQGRIFRLYGRVGYCKIQKGGSVVRNFIPARRDSDGVLGMYDMMTNTFFTNGGTGEFIAGPVANLYMPSGN